MIQNKFGITRILTYVKKILFKTKEAQNSD
jgi:hypothetical protein